MDTKYNLARCKCQKQEAIAELRGIFREASKRERVSTRFPKPEETIVSCQIMKGRNVLIEIVDHEGFCGVTVSVLEQ